MKTALKVLTALAALVGVAYVIATYGDKIVEWCKNLLNSCPCKADEEDFADSECPADEAAEEAVAGEEVTEEAPAEEPAAEEAVEEPVVEEAAEEITAEEIAADETAPVADEEDFAG